jgi:beta-phosphoglucomutase-like phosphatase (HAD superfamily)
MVKAKKPDPAIYLMAIDALNLDRSSCIVVEDSNIGLTSAHAAGIRCVVTKSTYTEHEDFSAAALVMPDLGDPGSSPFDLADFGSLLT